MAEHHLIRITCILDTDEIPIGHVTITETVHRAQLPWEEWRVWSDHHPDCQGEHPHPDGAVFAYLAKRFEKEP
jgi:hypothetical protein